jgi:hypothetical protein
MPNIADTIRIVDQAIKIGSCGSPVLRTKLESQRNSIAAIFCAQNGKAANQSKREVYLRVLLEVLKIAVVHSASMVDFTEAREDASRKMDQRLNANRSAEGTERKNGTTSGTMTYCAYRNWERHRLASDESSSTALSAGHSNSYNYFRDTSAQKAGAGEEGITENHSQGQSESHGEGTTIGSRESQKLAYIKPRGDDGLGGSSSVPDSPPTPEITLLGEACDMLGAVTGLLDAVGIKNAFECVKDVYDIVKGDATYDAGHIAEESGFQKDDSSKIGFCDDIPTCGSVLEADSLCSIGGGEGGSVWAARAAALPATYSNDYNGDSFLEFNVGLTLLGSGFGISFRFNLKNGESFSQTARIDQGYDSSTMSSEFCSDQGSLNVQKGRNENIAISAKQTKNDRHRRGEKASERGSTLVALSTGAMRFSGKSKTGSDRVGNRTTSTTMVRKSSMTELSNATLADISGMKMKSVTEYRSQIVKMLNDMMKNTMRDLELMHESKGRVAAVEAKNPEIQARCDSPIGLIGARYIRPTIRGKYPLMLNRKF